MLLIYGALPVGGIETFFVRLAKERKKAGLFTAILLLSKPEASNKELLSEMCKYAQVLFPKDLFSISPLISQWFPLLSPVRQSELISLFKCVDQIHVELSVHALLGHRLSKMANKNLPITIGFYHYITHLWGGNSIAHFEKVNRRFVFEYLPKDCLIMFSEGTRQLYTKYKKMNFDKSKTFRLGVVDYKEVDLVTRDKTPLRIVAVGRLVDFKTYNFYMLDVLNSLLEKGYLVEFDIYGDGPLKSEIKKKIDSLKINQFVCLKGTLDYSLFDETVSEYDLFIGSGTAIIQAASLGVPAIVGVENVLQSKTYGYFCDVYNYEYNLKGLDLPLISVEKMIEDYYSLSESDKIILRKSHLNSIKEFTNESCNLSMEQLKTITMPSEHFKFNRWSYDFSRVLDKFYMMLYKNHPRVTKFDEFRFLDEEK
ncbi:MAG: hypothetical protein NWQ54_09100 [Paraglaciecola sp.]|nr:hypothetical protein [Paraglaciecola sp.]